MRFSLWRCLLFSVIICLYVSMAEAGIINVYFSDYNLRYTLYTFNDGQAEYVQLDKVAQMFRFALELDPADGRMLLRNNEKMASFFPGDATVVANRQSYFLDLPPRKVEGVFMVPLQFLTDILPLLYDGKVAWDPVKRNLQAGLQNLEITKLYVGPYGDYTRIVVELSQNVTYKVTETLPVMLVFELPRSSFAKVPNPLQVNSRGVKQVKLTDSFGTTQMIVRLGAEFDHYTHQLVDRPARLQIDVYHKAAAVPTPPAGEVTPDPWGIKEEDLTQEPGKVGPAAPKKFALRTIVIDPGHGGSDPGVLIAPAAGDKPAVFEKDITLTLAQLLATTLKQRLGKVVVLTREGDNFVSAEERTTLANNNRASVFVSLHVNNAAAAGLSGFEVYVMDYGSLDLPEGYQDLSAESQGLDYAQAKYVERSKRLAQQILAARKGTLKSAPLFTLKGATMPAVHIEIGYSSNAQDRAAVQQDAFQQALVGAIADGIAAFKKQEEQ